MNLNDTNLSRKNNELPRSEAQHIANIKYIINMNIFSGY